MQFVLLHLNLRTVQKVDDRLVVKTIPVRLLRLLRGGREGLHERLEVAEAGPNHAFGQTRQGFHLLQEQAFLGDRKHAQERGILPVPFFVPQLDGTFQRIVVQPVQARRQGLHVIHRPLGPGHGFQEKTHVQKISLRPFRNLLDPAGGLAGGKPGDLFGQELIVGHFPGDVSLHIREVEEIELGRGEAKALRFTEFVFHPGVAAAGDDKPDLGWEALQSAQKSHDRRLPPVIQGLIQAVDEEDDLFAKAPVKQGLKGVHHRPVEDFLGVPPGNDQVVDEHPGDRGIFGGGPHVHRGLDLDRLFGCVHEGLAEPGQRTGQLQGNAPGKDPRIDPTAVPRRAKVHPPEKSR